MSAETHPLPLLLLDHTAITVLYARPLDRALQHGDLVTERAVLENELRAVLDGQLEQLDQDAEVGHPSMVTEVPLDAQARSC